MLMKAYSFLVLFFKMEILKPILLCIKIVMITHTQQTRNIGRKNVKLHNPETWEDIFLHKLNKPETLEEKMSNTYISVSVWHSFMKTHTI